MKSTLIVNIILFLMTAGSVYARDCDISAHHSFNTAVVFEPFSHFSNDYLPVSDSDISAPGQFLVANNIMSADNESVITETSNTKSFTERHNIYPLLAGLTYAGGCMFLREKTYRHRPGKNFMGTINGYSLITGALLYAGALTGGSITYEIINEDNVPICLAGAFIGAIAGATAGVIISHKCHAPRHFKKHRPLYYALPALAVTIGAWKF